LIGSSGVDTQKDKRARHTHLGNSNIFSANNTFAYGHFLLEIIFTGHRRHYRQLVTFHHQSPVLDLPVRHWLMSSSSVSNLVDYQLFVANHWSSFSCNKGIFLLLFGSCSSDLLLFSLILFGVQQLPSHSIAKCQPVGPGAAEFL